MEYKETNWNKCDYCGKYISFKEFENGSAAVIFVTPDSEFTKEEYEVFHKICRGGYNNGTK